MSNIVRMINGRILSMLVVVAVVFIGCKSSENDDTSSPEKNDEMETRYTLGELLDTETMRDVRQVVVVRSASWDATEATMIYYNVLGPDEWQVQEPAQAVTVGKNGMAWGLGKAMAAKHRSGDPEKVEGDGRAPAGVFDLSFVFGYETHETLIAKAQPFTKMPYIGVDELVECIDDPASSHYNSIWVKKEGEKDWNSSEKMLRADSMYWMGVFVDHNKQPKPEAGKGSCIFMHIWRAPGSPTLVCTAMSKAAMIKLAHWLDPEKKPVLIQLPDDVFYK